MTEPTRWNGFEFDDSVKAGCVPGENVDLDKLVWQVRDLSQYYVPVTDRELADDACGQLAELELRYQNLYLLNGKLVEDLVAFRKANEKAAMELQRLYEENDNLSEQLTQLQDAYQQFNGRYWINLPLPETDEQGVFPLYVVIDNTLHSIGHVSDESVVLVGSSMEDEDD